MSQIPPDDRLPGVEVPPPPPEEIPRWVPILIGVVLVSLAALAVITGLRYRDNTLVSIVNPRGRSQSPPALAPPGEPEAGASLVLSGDSGGNVPQANDGAEGLDAGTRLSARRGMQMKVDPAEAIVSVNDVVVGQARQFDSEDEIYDFAEPGSYNVRIHADGFRARQFVVTATPEAEAEIARIEVKLERAQDSGPGAQKPRR